ncbi:hypothetical protein I3842_05G119500 [Carya illinoinensis]|uniref:J domain-containing protein n=1 Tax=Carya illinoinensis TaxID=32201 RepID=A0A922JPZ4_CARIL|nr:hypothetical protein I3842_05G119500 [Carya illinoinensis]
MRGKGVSRGHSQAGTSGNKRLKSGNGKGTPDDVVLIDVDSGMSCNVVIIDVPEPPIKRRLRGSSVQRKAKKSHHQDVISLDDDESDVLDHPGLGDKGGGELDSDATSSKRSCPTSKNMQNSVDVDGDECSVVDEKRYSFRLSKCKQTYSDKAACGNRYGLYLESESGSSESDCSDSELMEGSFGKLHEQWKKASLKRKRDLHNSQSGLDDQSGIPVCPSSSITDCEKENLSTFHASADGYMGGTSFDPDMERPYVEDQRVHQTFAEDPPPNHEWQSCNHVNGHGDDFFCSEQSPQRPHFSTDKEHGDKQPKCARSNQEGEIHADLDGAVLSNEDDEFPQAPSSCYTSDETNVNPKRVVSNEAGGNEEQVNGIGNVFCNKEAHSPRGSFLLSNQDQGFKRSKCKRSNKEYGGMHANLDGGVLRQKDEECHRASNCNNSDEKDRLVSNSPLSDEMQVDCGGAHPDYKDRTGLGESFCNTPLEGNSGVNNKKVLFVDKVITDSEQLFFSNSRLNETHLVEAKVTYDVRDPILAQDGDASHTSQKDIINEREKLKETDEYKRAIEEEWASRQHQLQIQAEEARRLRKERRVERRLLDMQRRQKQRVEEVRETQKKDEENMNLKEQLRVDVREELNKLESTCMDMASLLRGLGIQVGGSVYSLSHEVHAAYRRALLMFHPDRTLKADIRQQVEAEEKFKLISRMKEKFLGT